MKMIVPLVFYKHYNSKNIYMKGNQEAACIFRDILPTGGIDTIIILG